MSAIEEIIRSAREAGASDVHLAAGMSPKMRIGGGDLPLPEGPATSTRPLSFRYSSAMGSGMPISSGRGISPSIRRTASATVPFCL